MFVQIESVQLAWNSLNQLTETTTKKTNKTETKTTYLYDAFGRRIAKITKDKAYWYTWDGDNLLQEHINHTQTNKEITQNTWTTVYEPHTFEPVARLHWGDAISDQTQKDQQISVYHYHNDHLGTPNELTDEQGEIIWKTTYQAWGNTVAEYIDYEKTQLLPDQLEGIQPIRFQGQQLDSETGLHYTRNIVFLENHKHPK